MPTASNGSLSDWSVIARRCEVSSSAAAVVVVVPNVKVRGASGYAAKRPSRLAGYALSLGLPELGDDTINYSIPLSH